MPTRYKSLKNLVSMSKQAKSIRECILNYSKTNTSKNIIVDIPVEKKDVHTFSIISKPRVTKIDKLI